MLILLSQIFSVIGIIALIMLIMYIVPIPFFDRNGATAMCSSPERRIATAKALSTVIGEPTWTLDTDDIQRFLFKDGTGIDSLVHEPKFQLMYEVTLLKSVVLGLLSRKVPSTVAAEIERSLKRDGFEVQLVTQPDSSFADGASVLVLSEAFRSDDAGHGFGLIVRKHAFRMGGQRPTSFAGWPSETFVQGSGVRTDSPSPNRGQPTR